MFHFVAVFMKQGCSPSQGADGDPWVALNRNRGAKMPRPGVHSDALFLPHELVPGAASWVMRDHGGLAGGFSGAEGFANHCARKLQRGESRISCKLGGSTARPTQTDAEDPYILAFPFQAGP